MGKKPNKKEQARLKEEAEKKAKAEAAAKRKEAAAARKKEEEEEAAAAAAKEEEENEQGKEDGSEKDGGGGSRRGSRDSGRSGGSRRGSRDESRRGSRDSRDSQEDERDRLRQLHDFESMRPFQLKDECRKRDLDPEGLRDELIERLLDFEVGNAEPEPELELPSDSELKEMKVSALTQLAKDAGIADAKIQDATDSDTPKPAIIQLLLREQQARRARLGSGGRGGSSEEGSDAGHEDLRAASDGTVSGSITLETELPKSAVKRREFEEAIIRDLAAKMGVDPSRVRITSLEMVEEEIGSHDGARDGNRDPPRPKPDEGLGPGGVWSSSSAASRAAEGGYEEGNGGAEEDEPRRRRGRSASRDSGGGGRTFEWKVDELGSMRFSALATLARKEGVGEGDIEECQDSEEPKKSIIKILQELHDRHNKARHSRSRSGGSRGGQQLDLPSGAELKEMRLSELTKLAREVGIDAAKIDDAADTDFPKPAVIELLEAARDGGGDSADDSGVDLPPASELKGMRVSELSRLAEEAGVYRAAIDDATDADQPKDALIELLEQKRRRSRSRERGGSAEREQGEKKVFGLTIDQLREEKFSKLRRIAAEEAELSERKIEAAGDADDPKDALIALLCEAAGVSPSSSSSSSSKRDGRRGSDAASDKRERGRGEGEGGGSGGKQQKHMEEEAAAEKPVAKRIAPENYKKMKQAGLQAACQKRGLSDQGNAKALLKRLEDYDKASASASKGGGGGKKR